MKQLTTIADPRKRMRKFLRKYQNAPADADIEIRVGHSADTAEPAVIVSIGPDLHGFTSGEARLIAAAAEDTLNKFPGHAETEGLPNLILALRYGADSAEKALLKVTG